MKNMDKLSLRIATIEDKSLLFEWRNITELVQLSYLKKNVTIEEHDIWFNEKLSNPDSEILIVELNNLPIGLIRMDVKIESCAISIYLIPGNHGRGYGFEALSLVLNNYNNLSDKYSAKVQTGNIPSQKLFLKLGFIESYRDDEFINYIK